MSHERRAEAREAGAGGAPSAGIDHARGPGQQQALGEILGCRVAVGPQAVDESPIAAQIVHGRAEVGERLVVGDAFVPLVDFSKLERLVEGHLRLGGFELEC